MEKGINRYIMEKFGLHSRDIRYYSPLVLAYIGDGIYDLVIRSMIVGRGNAHVNDMNREASQLVKAHTQSEMIRNLLPILTEEEQRIYRRGRNAKSSTVAKNATVADYRRATGFEAVMGYLYLLDETDRMMELILEGLKKAGKEISENAYIRGDEGKEQRGQQFG